MKKETNLSALQRTIACTVRNNYIRLIIQPITQMYCIRVNIYQLEGCFPSLQVLNSHTNVLLMVMISIISLIPEMKIQNFLKCNKHFIN